MGVRIRAPLRSDAVRDTMEDAVAGPDAGAMLENAMSWSTASRTAVAEGRSLDRHVQVFVDAVILYFLSVIQRATQIIFSNQVCPFKCQEIC